MQSILAEEAKRKREDDEHERKNETGMSKNKLKKLAKQARNPKKLARIGKDTPATCIQCRNLPVNLSYQSFSFKNKTF